MNKSIIFHVDVNSAFLSWEAVYRLHELHEELDIRTIPSAIGGDRKKRHGIILAKSIPAKKYNIQTGEPIQIALTKCPELEIYAPHYDMYERCSHTLLKILHAYSPIVEQYSIDEAFLDMTGNIPNNQSPYDIAIKLKDEIRDTLGFTVNIGVSCNKLLAKMASDFKKPDLVHTLFPEEIEKKMWPLPVRDLFFVGRATEKKLHSLGIRTIGDIAKTDLTILKSHLKTHGEVIYNYANGNDASFVNKEDHINKGYGNSITLPFDVCDYEIASLILLSLTETVGSRLRSHNVLTSLVSVEIKDYNFCHISHQKKLLSPTNVTVEIHKVVMELFKEAWDHKTPIRQLGVRTSSVTEDNIRQYNLFDMDRYDKLSKLDTAIDSIRGKYGDDAVIRASFLGHSVYHMSGGISPEKRKRKEEF